MTLLQGSAAGCGGAGALPSRSEKSKSLLVLDRISFFTIEDILTSFATVRRPDKTLKKDMLTTFAIDQKTRKKDMLTTFAIDHEDSKSKRKMNHNVLFYISFIFSLQKH